MCLCRAYQRAMVKSMTAAVSVPHFHFVDEINCDGIVELKSAFQKENTDPDVKFTFLPMLIKSLSMALTTHPLVNSTFNLENFEVTLKGSKLFDSRVPFTKLLHEMVYFSKFHLITLLSLYIY